MTRYEFALLVQTMRARQQDLIGQKWNDPAARGAAMRAALLLEAIVDQAAAEILAEPGAPGSEGTA